MAAALFISRRGGAELDDNLAVFWAGNSTAVHLSILDYLSRLKLTKWLTRSVITGVFLDGLAGGTLLGVRLGLQQFLNL